MSEFRRSAMRLGAAENKPRSPCSTSSGRLPSPARPKRSTSSAGGSGGARSPDKTLPRRLRRVAGLFPLKAVTANRSAQLHSAPRRSNLESGLGRSHCPGSGRLLTTGGCA
jgi:hypothetical protein